MLSEKWREAEGVATLSFHYAKHRSHHRQKSKGGIIDDASDALEDIINYILNRFGNVKIAKAMFLQTKLHFVVQDWGAHVVTDVADRLRRIAKLERVYAFDIPEWNSKGHNNEKKLTHLSKHHTHRLIGLHSGKDCSLTVNGHFEFFSNLFQIICPMQNDRL